MSSPLFSKSRRLKLPPRAGSGQQPPVVVIPVEAGPAEVDLGIGEVAPAKPKWDMSWSKAKLLEACSEQGISVEEADTKAVLLSKLLQG